MIALNGVEVQVFEYPESAARQDESGEISPDGSSIDTSMVSWIGQPNFWASGNLIVLYVGDDGQVQARLSEFLGAPITTLTVMGSGYPVAVDRVLEGHAEHFGLAEGEVEVISYEQVDWNDACLGLAAEDEACAEEITPGWKVILEAVGESHEYHTDLSGRAMRRR